MYRALTKFCLGPFSDDVRKLSFTVSIVDDNIPEDDEMFNVSLTLDPASRTRLGNRVIVSPDVATVTIQDNDGKHTYFSIFSSNTHIFIIIVTILIHMSICSVCSGCYKC